MTTSSGTCKRWIRVLVVASLLLGLADARRPMQRAVLPSEERFVADPVSVGVTSFRINASKVVSPWDHYWERCVGSGHAALALRADYQDQMRQTRNDLGFQQVRFHGLFVDDMSVALPAEDGTNGVLFSFFNIDRIFDFLLSIGMKPLVELSFMPSLLASGNQTWSHYEANVTPPTSYSQWADLIGALIKHLIQRYGLQEILTWSFEVWNEPNCCPVTFWTGGESEYFKLFEYTSRAAKAVHPGIRVGGPATAYYSDTSSKWIKDFKAYCQTNGVKYDFISTHQYPTEPPGPLPRTFFIDAIKSTKALVGDNLPLYYTEYDDGYNDDTAYSAAFVVWAQYAAHGVVDILSWWPFSDLFEEAGLYPDPFDINGLPVDGLLNVYGIPKPNYRAFQLLHWSGDKLVETTPNAMLSTNETLGVFAVAGESNTSIFLVNWNVKGQPITIQTAEVTVDGFPSSSFVKATEYRIDDTHANAYPLWVSMGKPAYLTPNQVAQLKTASTLRGTSLPIQRISADSIRFTVSVPAYSVVNVILS